MLLRSTRLLPRARLSFLRCCSSPLLLLPPFSRAAPFQVAGMPFFSFTQNRGEASLLPAEECIPGSEEAIAGATPDDEVHVITGNRLKPPYPDGLERAVLGMGCFWCSEHLFAKMKGVWSTAVGYGQGVTKNPSYEDICTGRTNHAELVQIVFDPQVLSFDDILKVFWEGHDPTTFMRQGNDKGTQYRSGIYFTTEEQGDKALESVSVYQAALKAGKHDAKIVTEIEPAKVFWFAEKHHQQYDEKPGSRQYCGLRPLGIPFSRSTQPTSGSRSDL